MIVDNTDQGETQSAEDRVAKLFSDEETGMDLSKVVKAEPEEVQEASEEQPESDEVEIEYEGSRYKVPKALEKGILQEADYTRKTQEVANQRKLLDQSLSTANLMMMENEFHQSVAEETQNLRVMDNYIKSLKAQNFNDMTAEDGFRQWMLIQQAAEQREALSKSIEGKHGEFKSKFQSALSEAKAKTHDLLSKSINGYTPKSFEAVKEYAKGQGFTEAVLESVETDPKAVAALYKAMRFDELQASKVASIKKLDAPTMKPGASNPMPQAVKDKLNYKKALKSAQTRDERNAIVAKRIESMF